MIKYDTENIKHLSKITKVANCRIGTEPRSPDYKSLALFLVNKVVGHNWEMKDCQEITWFIQQLVKVIQEQCLKFNYVKPAAIHLPAN